MSHQSGIKPSAELLSAFSVASQSEDQRALKVVISGEVLVVSETFDAKGGWEEDFPRTGAWLTPKDPCFVLYRLDSTGSSGAHDWILLQYVPDNAKVREKMLYAATKATLLQDLGGSKFVDTLYGTTPDDLSLDGYRRHIKHKDASAPLTEREQEQAAMRAAECTADVGSTSRKAHTSKTGNPLAEDGTAALLQLKEGAVKSVVLYMSLETEKISVKETGQKGFADLSSLVEPGAPRFVFFSYDTDSYAFVYVCPPAAKIREKMVYSTFRNSLILAVENDMEIKLTQKIEVDAIDELENPEHVSPVGTPETVKKSFGRPARPGRGPARVSRPTTPSSDL